jgi:hypothetical protein
VQRYHEGFLRVRSGATSKGFRNRVGAPCWESRCEYCTALTTAGVAVKRSFETNGRRHGVAGQRLDQTSRRLQVIRVLTDHCAAGIVTRRDPPDDGTIPLRLRGHGRVGDKFSPSNLYAPTGTSWRYQRSPEPRTEVAVTTLRDLRSSPPALRPKAGRSGRPGLGPSVRQVRGPTPAGRRRRPCCYRPPATRLGGHPWRLSPIPIPLYRPGDIRRTR